RVSVVSRMTALDIMIKSGKLMVSSGDADQPRSQGGRETSVPKKTRAPIASSDEIQMEEHVKEAFELNPNSKLTLESVKASWNEVLEALRAKRQMVIRASLFEGNVSKVEKGVITIEFPENYSHNKKRLEKQLFKSVLNDTVSMIVGEKVSIKLVVDESSNEDRGNDLEKTILDMQFSDIDIV
ncbi:MAG: hypothetical protein QMB63_08195, partial [Clostridiaceae bacterium]